MFVWGKDFFSPFAFNKEAQFFGSRGKVGFTPDALKF